MLILALELLEVLIRAIEDRGLAVGLGLALLGQERRAGRHRCNGGRELKLCLDHKSGATMASAKMGSVN